MSQTESSSVTTYFEKAHVPVSSASAIWRGICGYIQKDIDPNGCVLDLGAGYCSFINSIQARRKIAVDLNPEIARFAGPGVKAIQASATDLRGVEDGSVDAVFASNLFEHLSEEEMDASLQEIHRVLRPQGRLLILQPNFFYAYREYFHDYTHRKIYTHVGLADLLEAKGYEILRNIPRLVPFSMRPKYGGLGVPKLPLLHWLVRLYLHFPYRPLAKQMYLVCRKSS